MKKYPPGDGWGPDGLDVTNAGVVFRFDKPVSKVLVRVGSSAAVYVGFNEVFEVLTPAQCVAQGRPTDELHRVSVIEAADALAKGVEIPASGEQEFEFPIDPAEGRRGIYCIWFITNESETTNVTGGVTGM